MPVNNQVQGIWCHQLRYLHNVMCLNAPETNYFSLCYVCACARTEKKKKEAISRRVAVGHVGVIRFHRANKWNGTVGYFVEQQNYWRKENQISPPDSYFRYIVSFSSRSMYLSTHFNPICQSINIYICVWREVTLVSYRLIYLSF